MRDERVISIIEHYLYGGPQDWGYFTELSFKNHRLEHICQLCCQTESMIPGEREKVLNELIKKLRSGGLVL